jgi:hypothetical protein
VSLTEVEFPPGMSSISYGAFAYCSSLTKIILPASLSSIETAAFSDCTSLAEVALPTSLSSISYGAFANCSSLTKITLPAGIGSIKRDAFSGCTKLISLVSLNPTPPEARYAMWLNSAPGLRIQVPAGSVAAYKAAPGWENFADRISAIKDNFI